MNRHAVVAAKRAEERLALQNELEAMGFDVSAAHDVKSLTALLKGKEENPPLVLFLHDGKEMDAVGFLAGWDAAHVPPLIVMAPDGTIEEAIEAMRAGALDFITQPFNPEVLGFAIKRSFSAGIGRTRPIGGLHKEGHRAIVTRSPVMKKVLERARRVARSKATVLIHGESGTGKELMARYIHDHSDRSDGPFVAINCAALPETLLESELFGHEKGAFSGALARKPGRFELANHGTILLDEITEMVISLQAKLLRVLQEEEIDRLGGTKTIPVDVRVIATTNRDCLAAVRSGKFREDLYYRLNVIPLHLPPLRERPEDIPLLAEHFRDEFCSQYGRDLRFAPGVLEAMSRMEWPGNVRELRNAVERGVLLAEGNTIGHDDIFDTGTEFAGTSTTRDADRPGKEAAVDTQVMKLSDMEREMVKRALEKTKGNRTHAAKLLGISVRTLRNKLAEYREMGLVL